MVLLKPERNSARTIRKTQSTYHYLWQAKCSFWSKKLQPLTTCLKCIKDGRHGTRLKTILHSTAWPIKKFYWCYLLTISTLFSIFGWGTKVYVQNRLGPSNNTLHRFCLTVGSTLTSQWFVYQNRLEPSCRIYRLYTQSVVMTSCLQKTGNWFIE